MIHEVEGNKEFFPFNLKNRAKPSARRGNGAYASESDFHKSSFVIFYRLMRLRQPWMALAPVTGWIQSIYLRETVWTTPCQKFRFPVARACRTWQ